jgi:fido (protein-threonine AMPylation protein)
MSQNPFGRSAYEQAEYERHIYPDTDALRNKLGIKDRVELEKAERRFVAERARQGLPAEATAQTYEGFKAIHRHLFQDVYEWAGKERGYTTGRGQTSFARPEFISSYMEKQFEALKQQNFLQGMPRERFAHEAAKLVTEINAAHPFIDGNGRTQRTWLRQVAHQAGHSLVLQSADKERWNAASRTGFERSDIAPMADLLAGRLRENPAPTLMRTRDKDRDRER